MPTIVTMEDAVAHLGTEGLDDEADIALKLEAATDLVAGQLGRPLPWKDADGAEVPVPAAVKAAILLVLGDLYANRESSTVGAAHSDNPTLDRLLAAYVKVSIA
ncbi:head-tail connector protein [Azospirillum argentinense]